MMDANFQNFLVGGLLVLIGAIVFMAWSAWRYIDRERDMEKRSFEGVGHELRVNLQRMFIELGAVARGDAKQPSDLLPLTHPQLDGVLARPVETDRRALTVIHAAYDEMTARKQDIRTALSRDADPSDPIMAALEAAVAATATLYLWEEQGGRSPTDAHPTRTWAVRDWMKSHRFDAYAVPGVHLRDEVVECLRALGMRLTPKPLTYTASQYYAMQYDRKADPHGPFGRRRQKPEKVAAPEADLDVEVEPSPLAEDQGPATSAMH